MNDLEVYDNTTNQRQRYILTLQRFLPCISKDKSRHIMEHITGHFGVRCTSNQLNYQVNSESMSTDQLEILVRIIEAP